MKIIATLKSRDEERNIANAIESYHDWVDEILLADGGSVDKTIQIAAQYPKVKIKSFDGKYYHEDGTWRNHEGRHLNFLFEWAESENPDWIIHDDCDAVLNKYLHNQARSLFDVCSEDTIHVCRLFVYGQDRHFKKMAYINNKWQAGLWAWKASLKIRCKDVERHFDPVQDIPSISKMIVHPPLCVLHRFAPDETTIMNKVNDYKKEQPHAVHPRVIYGEPEPLPDWAII